LAEPLQPKAGAVAPHVRDGIADGAFVDVLLFLSSTIFRKNLRHGLSSQTGKKARNHSSFQYWHRAHSLHFPRMQPLLLPAMAIRSQVNCFS
jgi:hypothetical protein